MLLIEFLLWCEGVVVAPAHPDQCWANPFYNRRAHNDGKIENHNIFETICSVCSSSIPPKVDFPLLMLMLTGKSIPRVPRSPAVETPYRRLSQLHWSGQTSRICVSALAGRYPWRDTSLLRDRWSSVYDKASAADIREIRDLLRRFPRYDLMKITRDYVGFAEDQGKPSILKAEEIEKQTNEQLRKFIFERDYPGYKWRSKE